MSWSVTERKLLSLYEQQMSPAARPGRPYYVLGLHLSNESLYHCHVRHAF